MDIRIPIIDVTDWFGTDEAARDSLCRRIDDACRDLGFLVITGHRVDMALIDSLHRAAYAFFDLPVEQKKEIAFGKISSYGGYGATGLDRLDVNGDGPAVGDLKETFGMGPFGMPDEPYYKGPAGLRYFQPNAWPAQLPDMQPTFETAYRSFEAFANELMKMFARALSLDDDFFAASVDRHITHLNIQHYPVQDRDPTPGQIRAGAHTDFGSFTLLHPGERPEGLQVQDAKGKWHDVVIPKDAFVVNLGDLMARWTNDTWRSTLHRVINPPGQTRARERRQSVAFFHQPNYDAVIECLPGCATPDNPPRYGATTSGEHYTMKVNQMRKLDAEPAALAAAGAATAAE